MTAYKRVLLVVLFLCLTQLESGAAWAEAETNMQGNRPLLLTHYIPWYQTPDLSGYWGWHWTMDHFDPTQVDASGRPQIASHFIPLTGVYDSQMTAILEYQCCS